MRPSRPAATTASGRPSRTARSAAPRRRSRSSSSCTAAGLARSTATGARRSASSAPGFAPASSLSTSMPGSAIRLCGSAAPPQQGARSWRVRRSHEECGQPHCGRAVFSGNFLPMKEAATTRPYRQGRRAEAAEARTEAILQAAVEASAAKPFEQVTLADVAARAGVGVQTLIRRVQTKDGLVRAVNEWMAERIEAARGEPDSSDPDVVSAALARQYEVFGAVIDRTIRQEELSAALAEGAQAGRRAHRAWVEAAFATEIAAGGPLLASRLIAVCGVELWLVLRRDGGLSADQTRETIAHLIRSVPP